jgi:uncharacterized protein (DUF1778 family)
MSSLRDARIDLRLPADLKHAFESAAAYQGQTLSEFIVSTLRERALAIQRQQERTVLSLRDRDRVLSALDQAEPGDALLQAAERYKRMSRKGGPDVGDRAADEGS